MSSKSDLWENDPSLVVFSSAWSEQQKIVYFETVFRLGTDPKRAFKNDPKELARYRSWVASK